MKTQEEKKAESRLKVAKTCKGKKQMIKTGQPGAVTQESITLNMGTLAFATAKPLPYQFFLKWETRITEDTGNGQ